MILQTELARFKITLHDVFPFLDQFLLLRGIFIYIILKSVMRFLFLLILVGHYVISRKTREKIELAQFSSLILKNENRGRKLNRIYLYPLQHNTNMYTIFHMFPYPPDKKYPTHIPTQQFAH